PTGPSPPMSNPPTLQAISAPGIDQASAPLLPRSRSAGSRRRATAATASRHAAPKGGSSLVRALKARLHSAPVLRFAHLCTPRLDAGPFVIPQITKKEH